jgi:hypothetical protein
MTPVAWSASMSPANPRQRWFWDHEQRRLTSNLQDAAAELDAAAGLDARRLSVHGIIRE